MSKKPPAPIYPTPSPVLTRPAPQHPKPELYYIQNSGYCGNSLSWWRVDGHGYTSNLDDAWKVDRQKAESICRCRPDQDFMWPVEEIDRLAERHVTRLPESPKKAS